MVLLVGVMNGWGGSEWAVVWLLGGVVSVSNLVCMFFSFFRF